MKNIIYRVATLKDLPTLYKFEQGIISTERPFDSTLKPDPINYYDLKELVLNDNVQVVVAEINNEVISSGHAKIIKGKPYHKHTDYVYLGFMYVKPEYRGQGIIKAITETLKAWAKQQNLLEVRLEVYNDNTSAIKAYEKSGFKKHMIEMRMQIE